MTKKRWMAVCAAVIAFIMLFSVLFIAFEAHHDCHGRGCAICAQISCCINLLRQLALSVLVTAAAALLRMAAAQAGKGVSCAYHTVSLISLKVKLSD